ncbi:MAG: PepSY domain-containing protein [Rhodospirillales bacterium]|nr:PepSY domain-containing protein [Rhodospirillales bacterium]
MKAILTGIILVPLATLPVQADKRDRPSKDDISIESALQVTAEAGYRDVYQIEYDDGQWEVEALNSRGQAFDIDVDAKTGEIIRVKPD